MKIILFYHRGGFKIEETTEEKMIHNEYVN